MRPLRNLRATAFTTYVSYKKGSILPIFVYVEEIVASNRQVSKTDRQRLATT